MPVDRGGAAERLAARRVDAAAAGPGTRLLLVGPVDALHVKGLDEAGRQMDVGMPIPRPGFEHADAGAGVFAQPVGEHAARGARAHDHIVECICHLATLPHLVVQLIGQMRLHRRPLAGDDAVDDGVAQRAVRRDLMIAQDAVLLGAEPLDAAPARVIEKMRAEFNRDAIELFERMVEQQQFALGIDRAALHALGIPGRADLDAPVRRIDIHVGRHARDLAVGIENRPRHHRARRLQPKPAVDLLAHVLGARNGSVPELPELAILHRLGQSVALVLR